MCRLCVHQDEPQQLLYSCRYSVELLAAVHVVNRPMKKELCHYPCINLPQIFLFSRRCPRGWTQSINMLHWEKLCLKRIFIFLFASMAVDSIFPAMRFIFHSTFQNQRKTISQSFLFSAPFLFLLLLLTFK